MNHIHTVWALADTWTRISLVLLLIATLAQTVFVCVYVQRPWRRVRVGRALMLKSGSLAVLLWLSLVNAFTVYPDQREVGTFALCGVTAAICYQLLVLLTTPPYDPEEPDDPKPDGPPLRQATSQG